MRALMFKSSLELAVVAMLLAVVYGARIDSVPFHPDESQWIAMSFQFEEFLSCRFASPLWDRAYATILQPPAVCYVIGVGRRMGGYGVADLNKSWQWTQKVETNVRNGAMPSPGLLWWSRLPMSLLAVFAVAIGFVLLRESAGRLAGWIWVVLSAVGPYFLRCFRRAMGEACLAAGVMVVAFACCRALRANDRDGRDWNVRALLWLTVAGIGAGFAGASKLNGICALAAGLAVAAGMAFRLRRSIGRRLLFLAVAVVAVALPATITFVGLNPHLWPDPVGRTLSWFGDQVAVMGDQVRAFPGSNLDSAAKRLRGIPQRVFPDAAAVGGKAAVIPNALLFAAGVWWMVNGWRRRRDGEPRAYGLAAIVLVALATVPPALLTPLDWERYYLFPVVFATFFTAIGAGWWITWTRHVSGPWWAALARRLRPAQARVSCGP